MTQSSASGPHLDFKILWPPPFYFPVRVCRGRDVAAWDRSSCFSTWLPRRPAADVPDPGQRGSAEGTKSAAADTALPLEPLKGSNTKRCRNMDRTGEQKPIDSRQKMFPQDVR